MSAFGAEAFQIDTHHEVFWACEESIERSVGKSLSINFSWLWENTETYYLGRIWKVVFTSKTVGTYKSEKTVPSFTAGLSRQEVQQLFNTRAEIDLILYLGIFLLYHLKVEK